MEYKKGLYITKSALILYFLFNLTNVSFSQNSDSTKVSGHFGGTVTITNYGISFIPNFTLGKPAAIFDMSAGKGKLSFEPQFRFALTGKPWSFVFWWRYKLLNTDKFLINIGGHPSVTFKIKTLMIDGVSTQTTVANQYLAGELSPNYLLSKNASIGIYYFYGYGLDKVVVKNTHMFSLRSNFSNIRLSEQVYMRFNPQVYYLKMADKHGIYFSSSLTLAKRNFPLSVSSLINKTIQTEISASKNFLWNVSLTYSFNKEYVEK
ncbi:MAG: hypothetical protein EPN88_14480 [Bacteroidetes bacterium]|nr:MAG: hypothetical protein EPN88_14480 [Bacteroidota bacterium]